MIQTSSIILFWGGGGGNECTFHPCFESSPNGKNIGEFIKFSSHYGHIKYFIAAEFKELISLFGHFASAREYFGH